MITVSIFERVRRSMSLNVGGKYIQVILSDDRQCERKHRERTLFCYYRHLCFSFGSLREVGVIFYRSVKDTLIIFLQITVSYFSSLSVHGRIAHINRSINQPDYENFNITQIDAIIPAAANFTRVICLMSHY